MIQGEQRANVLVAEDEVNVRRVIIAHLRRAGYQVHEAPDAKAARGVLEREPIDVVITDLKMGDTDNDGMDLLRHVVQRAPEGTPPVPVILLTAHGTADTALDAVEAGAWNLISKPCDFDELLQQVANALQARRDAQRSDADRRPPEQDGLPGRYGMIGRAPIMGRIFDTIEAVADSPSTVLLLGESGTGKELVTEALHRNSSRRDKPLVKVNCSAIPENLLETELFGHEKGAFTGAVTSRQGRMEQADGGTLFLDEIGDLRPDLQVKLLRVLQQREFERVGGSKTLKVDFRLIAATHRDLAGMVAAGQFREDLYYRLNVVPVQVPPLRERKEDIPFLLEHFRRKYNRRLEKRIAILEPTLVEALERLPWPGNIRELEAVFERMMNFATTTSLGIRDLPPDIIKRLRQVEPPEEAPREATSMSLPPGVGLKNLVREETSRLERDIILQALEETGWNVTRTAERLQLSRKGLQIKMKELDLRRDDEG